MFEFWETEELKLALKALGKGFLSSRSEISHNGETVKYSSKYEIRLAANEIVKVLRSRGEMSSKAPVRVLFPYQVGEK